VKRSESIAVGIAAAAFAAAGWATVAAAHDITIEAAVKGQSLVVAVRYEDGSRPAAAEVVVSDGNRTEMVRTSTSEAELTVPLAAVRDGAIIEASDGDGHATYRILTAADIQRMRKP